MFGEQGQRFAPTQTLSQISDRAALTKIRISISNGTPANRQSRILPRGHEHQQARSPGGAGEGNRKTRSPAKDRWVCFNSAACRTGQYSRQLRRGQRALEPARALEVSGTRRVVVNTGLLKAPSANQHAHDRHPMPTGSRTPWGDPPRVVAFSFLGR